MRVPCQLKIMKGSFSMTSQASILHQQLLWRYLKRILVLVWNQEAEMTISLYSYIASLPPKIKYNNKNILRHWKIATSFCQEFSKTVIFFKCIWQFKPFKDKCLCHGHVSLWKHLDDSLNYVPESTKKYKNASCQLHRGQQKRNNQLLTHQEGNQLRQRFGFCTAHPAICI